MSKRLKMNGWTYRWLKTSR